MQLGLLGLILLCSLVLTMQHRPYLSEVLDGKASE